MYSTYGALDDPGVTNGGGGGGGNNAIPALAPGDLISPGHRFYKYSAASKHTRKTLPPSTFLHTMDIISKRYILLLSISEYNTTVYTRPCLTPHFACLLCAVEVVLGGVTSLLPLAHVVHQVLGHLSQRSPLGQSRCRQINGNTYFYF